MKKPVRGYVEDMRQQRKTQDKCEQIAKDINTLLVWDLIHRDAVMSLSDHTMSEAKFEKTLQTVETSAKAFNDAVDRLRGAGIPTKLSAK